MLLSEDEILILLDLLAKTTSSGFGYSDNPKIAQLQAKLSVMLEVKRNPEYRSRPPSTNG